jgi:hypothetical protein
MYFSTHNFSWCPFPAGSGVNQPPGVLLFLSQYYGNVRGASQQRLEPTAGAKRAPLAGRRFVSGDLVNKQIITVHTEVLLGIGNGGGKQFAYVPRSDLVGELEGGHCLNGWLAADQIDNQAGLLRGNTAILKFSANISCHDYLAPVDLSDM